MTSSVAVSQLGEYQLVRRLGAGGMGEVFLGFSPTAHRVAVKVIRPNLISDDIRQRFANEVEYLRTAYGAHVARFEGADLEADPPWLATDYVPGLTLKEAVDQWGPLAAELGAMTGAMLAEGLDKVHAAGLLHRDVKPHNVIMGGNGPVLIDFGVATLLERDSGLTGPEHIVGTPAFMAPEQARGAAQSTGQADIYGLAATLVYAVTGHTLYPGFNGWPLVMRIGDPAYEPDLSGVPPALESLVAAMLAFDPTARPPLPEVRERLVQVATSGQEHVQQVRQRLVAATYDPAADVVAGAEIDPVRDPEAAEAAAGPAEATPAETPEAPRISPPPVDVGWLVDRLRKQYARRAEL